VRHEDVEDRVREAVERLLDQGLSFTELSVARIAREAGIGRSTFYLHFPDKTQLLIRIGEQPLAMMFEPAVRWWLRDDHDDGPEGVARTMLAMIQRFREHRPLMLAALEVAGYEPEVARYHLERVHSFIALVRDRLAELQAAGRVDPGLDPAATADLLTWLVERTLSHHVRVDDGSGDERVAAALGRAIWLVTYGGR
jgi:AcrR family transcriptional regulator